jgi:hypothetical protein
MSDRTFQRLAVAVGLVVGLLVSGSYAVGASGGGQAPASSSGQATAAEPDRVSGASLVLDSFEAGGTAGPGIANGIVATVLGSQQLPPPGDQAQAALLSAVSTAVQQMVTRSPGMIGALRSGLAPLACTNDGANVAIDAGASALDQGAESFGEVIQPFDVTTQEVAMLLRSGKEQQPEGC